MNQQNSLQKKIGFWSATSIVVGSIIGSGVFMKPATMAAQLGSPVWLTLVWIIAGLFSLFGALIFAELGAMMPETGGIYTYFRRMFGEFFAFLYGWAAFAVINTAAVAAISFVCAQYADYFLQLPRFDITTEQAFVWHIPFIGDLYPLQNFGVKSLAVAIVIMLSALNYRSVKAGSSFQLISTIVKMGVIGALIAGILFSGKGSFQNFFQAENPKEGMSLLSGIVVAMTGAFMAYDGWINVTFIAGEIKQPQKNIPGSLIVGVFACIIIYVLVNQAYLYVLPVEKLASSSLVASDAISIALGNTSGAIVAAMIVICTLGSVNGNVMANCRVTYAMGKDRVFLPWAGKTHTRYHTPGNAVWLHAVWTSAFIITGSFDMLADMFVFITWIAYLFGAIGIFLFRKRMPDQPRPYKIWGYPVVPILFIAFSSFYVVMTIWNDVTNYLNDRQPVINSVLGLVITAVGVPLYFYFKRKSGGN
ncbi:APC family permease [Terrimonas pollutisoli]|uniref:APC family permease n=1 Tax=Terrimonas pollutisoli TaxID=3034147 RepID=UPI0023EBB81D|nr:amino acid permease [Terrimonas sp. H1YJ31]